jgi:hypothetical protein
VGSNYGEGGNPYLKIDKRVSGCRVSGEWVCQFGTAYGQQRARSVCVGLLKFRKALNLRRMSLQRSRVRH